MHGKGVLTFFDNSKYEGQFTEGKLDVGTITLQNGKKYEWDFNKGFFFEGQRNEKNKPHGDGTLIFDTQNESVEQYKGNFKNGLF